MGQQEFEDTRAGLEVDDAEARAARAARKAYQRGLRDGQSERVSPDPDLEAKREIVRRGTERNLEQLRKDGE